MSEYYSSSDAYTDANETFDFYSSFYNETAAPTASTVPSDSAATYLHEARFETQVYVDKIFQSHTFRKYISAKLQYAASSKEPVEIVGVYQVAENELLAVDFVSRDPKSPPELLLNLAIRSDNRYELGNVSYIPNINNGAFWSLASEHRCEQGTVAQARSIYECYRACKTQAECTSFSYGPERDCVIGKPLCQGINDVGTGRIYGLRRDVVVENSDELVIVLVIVMFVTALAASACVVCTLLKREASNASNFLHASMLQSGSVSEVPPLGMTETVPE